MISRFLSLFLLHIDLWKLKEKSKKSHIACIAYFRKLKKTTSYIGIDAAFDGIPKFPHGITNIFITGGAKIGKNCTIFQNVTIAANEKKDSKKCGYPTIGDNVFIGANSVIVGSVTIGDNVFIGAGTVVCSDVPSNSTVVGSGCRIINHNN